MWFVLMRILLKKIVVIGIIILIFGAVILYLNYEKQTINLPAISTRQTILEYHAPYWDPFPHHAKILVQTEEPVNIVSTLMRPTEKTEKYSLHSGEIYLAIYPEETLKIQVENLSSTKGTIQTVLWCESWNYSAIFLFGFGIALLLVCVFISISSNAHATEIPANGLISSIKKKGKI